MSVFKKTGKILGDAVRVTGKLGAEAVKLSGDALHSTTRFVKSHEHEIAKAAHAAVHVSVRVVKTTGQALASGASGGSAVWAQQAPAL